MSIGVPKVPYSLPGQPLEKIEKDADRDFFMSAEEAKEYGLIDRVLSKS